MKNLFLDKPFAPVTAICVLFGAVLFIALMLPNHAVAQPTTFISPLSQPEPFLSVPYYGAKEHTAYFDHEFPTYAINDRIVLYDGRTIQATNGVCGWNLYGDAIAYREQPNGQGECIWYDGHDGHDFSLYYEPVLASADGVVVRSGWHNWADRNAGYGLHLRIEHDGDYETRYGHLSALTVTTDTLVTRGQIIGTSGDTGNSNAPHLHFEVRSNGSPTDPFGGSGSNWLWQDGSWNGNQWIGQPEPRYGMSFIVDDDNPQTVGDPNDNPYFTKGHGGISGSSCPPDTCVHWYRDTSIGWESDMLYTYLSPTPDYWVKWSPPRYGLYDVQVWIPGNHATTWYARYWLVSSYFYMPMQYIVVDQWGTSNQWIDLGTYQFGNWPQPWIGLWISDGQVHSSEYLRQLGIDAIRFRAPWPVYIPLVLKNS